MLKNISIIFFMCFFSTLTLVSAEEKATEVSVSTSEMSTVELVKELGMTNSKRGEILALLIKKGYSDASALVSKNMTKLSVEDKTQVAYNSRFMKDGNIASILTKWLEESNDSFLTEYCVLALKYQEKDVALEALTKFKEKGDHGKYIDIALSKSIAYLESSTNLEAVKK